MERKPQKPPNIINRPLSKGKAEVSLSAFAFLFAEFIRYSEGRVSNFNDLEKRLSEAGYMVGVRMLELLSYRSNQLGHETGGGGGGGGGKARREVKLLPMLTFVAYTAWKALFGKQCDSLEKSTELDDEFMIQESQPLPLAKFISVPKDYAGLNCQQFIAGLIEGLLDAADFPARVTAHTVSNDSNSGGGGGGRGAQRAPPATVFLIKFHAAVIARSVDA